MEKVVLTAEDGYKLSLHIFETENPKGCVQIIHGMEEHQERYEPLAARLNSAGYTVISSDMRGHGETAPVLGYFGEEKGCRYLLSDQIRITSYIRHRFHVERVILFAHSMGTIIARNLLQSQSDRYEKIILSGYPCGNPAAGLGILLTGFIKKYKSGQYYSASVQKMAIGSFHKKGQKLRMRTDKKSLRLFPPMCLHSMKTFILNKRVPDRRTDLDWISANEENINAYINDSYCGHGFRTAAFHDLFRLVRNMEKVDKYHNVQKNLPILALRGKDDPCTGGDKGSAASLMVLQEAGFARITSIDYPGMRHEILNEKDNESVYQDILEFLAH